MRIMYLKSKKFCFYGNARNGNILDKLSKMQEMVTYDNKMITH